MKHTDVEMLEAMAGGRDGVKSRDGIETRVVALRERGLTYQAVADELGLASRGAAREHVGRYLDAREDAAWLLEAGPDESDLE